MFIDRNGNPVNYDFEKEEQMLVRKYLPRNASVLELGARYGTVSCTISEILEDPTRHVAVDPDTSVIEALEKNRNMNGGKFHIFNGVVSENGFSIKCTDSKLEFAEYGTYTVKSDSPNIDNISLKDLQMKYNLEFDYLVADCEGFLYDFIKENEWFLDQITGIIYEQDGTPWEAMVLKYRELDDIFKRHNFEIIHTIPHPLYANNPRLHNVLKKRLITSDE